MITGQVRWVARQIRHYQLQEPLSQLIWLAAVAVFAFWTYRYFPAPAGRPAWIGVAIRTSVYALWGQVAREWCAVRWRRSASRWAGEYREEL